MDTDAVDQLQLKRADAERRLADLQAERGDLLVDGKAVAGVARKIEKVRGEIEAIGDAEAALHRREASARSTGARDAYLAKLESYCHARSRRVEAIERAEKLTRELGGVLREVLDAAREGEAASTDLHHRISPGTFNSDTATAPANVGQRLGSYVAGVLRSATGQNVLGRLQFAAMPGDLPPDADWAKAERAVSDMAAYFERRAPVEEAA